MHVHVELSDWLGSVQATSSRRFGYLSAGRSWLTMFLRNRSSKTVSILASLICLARRPHPVGRPLLNGVI